MVYRHTRLLDRVGLGTLPSAMSDIDGHMKMWADDGWELVSVTSVTRDGAGYAEITHYFFWSHAGTPT